MYLHQLTKENKPFRYVYFKPFFVVFYIGRYILVVFLVNLRSEEEANGSKVSDFILND